MGRIIEGNDFRLQSLSIAADLSRSPSGSGSEFDTVLMRSLQFSDNRKYYFLFNASPSSIRG
jgi:hypothetical protein